MVTSFSGSLILQFKNRGIVQSVTIKDAIKLCKYEDNLSLSDAKLFVGQINYSNFLAIDCYEYILLFIFNAVRHNQVKINSYWLTELSNQSETNE